MKKKKKKFLKTVIKYFFEVCTQILLSPLDVPCVSTVFAITSLYPRHKYACPSDGKIPEKKNKFTDTLVIRSAKLRPKDVDRKTVTEIRQRLDQIYGHFSRTTDGFSRILLTGHD